MPDGDVDPSLISIGDYFVEENDLEQHEYDGFMQEGPSQWEPWRSEDKCVENIFADEYANAF